MACCPTLLFPYQCQNSYYAFDPSQIVRVSGRHQAPQPAVRKHLGFLVRGPQLCAHNRLMSAPMLRRADGCRATGSSNPMRSSIVACNITCNQWIRSDNASSTYLDLVISMDKHASRTCPTLSSAPPTLLHSLVTSWPNNANSSWPHFISPTVPSQPINSASSPARAATRTNSTSYVPCVFASDATCAATR